VKLGAIVALWGREAIAQLSLTRFARAARATNTRLVAITDEPGNGSMAAELGFDVVEAPNEPLSDKHNAGMRRLRGEVDAVVVLGSDNWITDNLFGVWSAQLEAHPIVGVVDSWQVCTHRPESLYFGGYQSVKRRGESIGVARALRSDVLDAVDWSPWPAGLAKGLDWGMRGRLMERGHRIVGGRQQAYGVRVIGLKSPDGLTPFERFEGASSARLVRREDVLTPFPADERAALERICTYRRR
jgi:hypothetical protein